LQQNSEGSEAARYEDPAIEYLCEAMGFPVAQASEIIRRHREYPMEDDLTGANLAQSDIVQCG
jgi:hypothetical protein